MTEIERKAEAIRQLLENPFDGFGLTDREAEAANRIANGESVEEISKALGVSHQAIYERLKGFSRKTDISAKDIQSTIIKKIKIILGG